MDDQPWRIMSRGLHHWRLSDKPRKLVSPVGRPGKRGTALPPVRIARIPRIGAKPVARPAAFVYKGSRLVEGRERQS